LQDYVIATDRPRLHLLKAGAFDEAYARKVAGYDWQGLYAGSPYLLRALSARLADLYDWVLIDSRTGLTDTSGICTMLMPDTLVAVFTPNRQSLEGVLDLVRDATRYRSASDDLRPLRVYPLPSRIEASEPGLRRQWRHGDSKAGATGYQPAFEALMREAYQLPDCRLEAYFDEVQIQHVPRFAYGEEIAVLGEEAQDRLSMTRSFQRFAERLAEGVLPWDIAPGAATDEPAPAAGVPLRPTQERAADLLLRDLRREIAGLRESAARARSIDQRLRWAGLLWPILVLAVVGTMRGYLPMLSEVGSGAAAGIGIVAGLWVLLIAARDRLGFGQRAWLQARQADELEVEQARFEAGIGDYAGEDALMLLRARFELLQRAPDPGAGGRPAVYISYRRDDAAGYAGRLYDGLAQALGANAVFMDVESIEIGVDFRVALSRRVAEANVMLILIGPEWLASRDAGGRRRIDDPNDFVRIEIAQALIHERSVIPLLIDGATMPRPDEVPTELRPLTHRQALEMSHRRWDSDLARLLDVIRRRPS
jgi:hypothetical protein